MRCIVLPGMDGTGDLLHGFAAAMAPRFEVEVIGYPRDRPMGYDALVEWVMTRLPAHEPYLLLGESFSGPVAIRVAAQRPEGLRGLVLCASFARAPRPPWSPCSAAWLPHWATQLPVSRVPVRLLAQLMLGRWADARWCERIGASLDLVAPSVLAHRLDQVRGVDAIAALGTIDCPMLYLRASRDRLVSHDSGRAIRQARPDTSCVAIEAPHFVLQACPAQAAAAVREWCDATMPVGAAG